MNELSNLRALALSEATSKKNDKSKIKKIATTAAVAAVLPFAIVAGIIIAPIICFAGSVFANKDKQNGKLTEYNDKDFSELIKQMTDVQKKLISMQKSSKYNSLVYRYHNNGSFGVIEHNKYHDINIKSEFDKGKRVYPRLCVMYFSYAELDTYKNLIDSIPDSEYKGRDDYYDDPYFDTVYDEICSEMTGDIGDLGFTDSKHYPIQSTKYPLVSIGYKMSQDGIWVTIFPKNTTGAIVKEKNTALSNMRKLARGQL